MWIITMLRIRQSVVRAATAFIALAAVLAASGAATPARAQEYLQVCDLYGSGFFYIPGDSQYACATANQILSNEYALARQVSRASTGIAMAAALVNPFLPDGTNYAVSLHWAGFEGRHAVGFAAMMRLKGNLTFTAGLATGLDYGSLSTVSHRTEREFGTAYVNRKWSELQVLGRAGLAYTW